MTKLAKLRQNEMFDSSNVLRDAMNIVLSTNLPQFRPHLGLGKFSVHVTKGMTGCSKQSFLANAEQLAGVIFP